MRTAGMASPAGASADTAGAPVPAAPHEASTAGAPGVGAEKKAPAVSFQEGDGSAASGGGMQSLGKSSSRQVRHTAAAAAAAIRQGKAKGREAVPHPYRGLVSLRLTSTTMQQW